LQEESYQLWVRVWLRILRALLRLSDECSCHEPIEIMATASNIRNCQG
jgi:hypothetical protein